MTRRISYTGPDQFTRRTRTFAQRRNLGRFKRPRHPIISALRGAPLAQGLAALVFIAALVIGSMVA